MTVLLHMIRFTVLTVIMIATIPRNNGTIMRSLIDVFCSVLMASISLRELLLEIESWLNPRSAREVCEVRSTWDSNSDGLYKFSDSSESFHSSGGN